MTPAINILKTSGFAFQTHEYRHNPGAGAYGQEAADLLKLPAEQVFKTLLVALDGNAKRLAVGIIPVNHQLDVKALAKAMGAKKAEMADPKQAERSSGYLVGGISPLGQKRLLPTALDHSALNYATIFVSGGRRGLEIELAPDSLLQLCKAEAVSLCR